MIASEDLPTDRLILEPLRPGHAREMVEVLSSPELYTHMGGGPPTLDALTERYERLTAGSPDPTRTWLNWVARRRSDEAVAGTVQVTLRAAEDGGGAEAELAWVFGVRWQRQGLASEAARRVADELHRAGVVRLVARIDPGHAASEGVARRLGLRPSPPVAGAEEVEWRSGPPYEESDR
jgi:RimJ/RimL family protein N-acetyltransferase